MSQYILTMPEECENKITWCMVEANISRDEVLRRAFALFEKALRADIIKLVSKDGSVQIVRIK